MLPLRRLEMRRAGAKGSDLAGDVLSSEGIEEAYRLGRSLRIGYTHLFSSGSQRATQTIACMLAGMGRPVLNGVAVRADLGPTRSPAWSSAMEAACDVNPQSALEDDELVLAEAERLATTLRSILATLPNGSYALAVTDDWVAECAIYGLTGKLPNPPNPCGGFLIAEFPGGRLTVEGVNREHT